MKTETLNEYIFGKMVADLATEIKLGKARKLTLSGASQREISEATKDVTPDEIKEALIVLNCYRVASLQALQESFVEPLK